jgi:hypothetical protein
MYRRLSDVAALGTKPAPPIGESRLKGETSATQLVTAVVGKPEADGVNVRLYRRAFQGAADEDMVTPRTPKHSKSSRKMPYPQIFPSHFGNTTK